VFKTNVFGVIAVTVVREAPAARIVKRSITSARLRIAKR